MIFCFRNLILLISNPKKLSLFIIFIYFTFYSFFQTSMWVKLRKAVRWSPFMQSYTKKNYRWIQLAGHSGTHQSFILLLSQGLTSLACITQILISALSNLEESFLPAAVNYIFILNTHGSRRENLHKYLNPLLNFKVMDVSMETIKFWHSQRYHQFRLQERFTLLTSC